MTLNSFVELPSFLDLRCKILLQLLFSEHSLSHYIFLNLIFLLIHNAAAKSLRYLQ